MNPRQSTEHLISSIVSALTDALAVLGGLWLATWIRFDSGFFAINPLKGRPDDLHLFQLSALAAVIFILVFRTLRLYARPRQGRFEDTVPRTLRAILISFVLYVAAEAFFGIDPSLSRLALLIGLVTVPFCVVLGRYLLYRIEWNLARHMTKVNRVLILGTDAVAARIGNAIEQEPFLRSTIAGYIRTDASSETETELEEAVLAGGLQEVREISDRLQINHVILCDIAIPREDLIQLSLHCEQNYVQFQIVPDMFRILTTNVDVQNLAGIPLMGLSRWPLDHAANRILKRVFDVGFSCFALLLTAPLLLAAAIAVKLTSRGPVFYLQERCGENGKRFNMIKLRTMKVDAEENGPGWTTPDDPRKTPVGGFLRRWNLDELPQFFNVLSGHMSVVGPRPERPHYVEQFKDEIERYMRRHVNKPGITGWAQVNGLRGDTSIEERIRYDLFYLENWSIGLDVKTILKTIATRKNAY